MVGLMHEATKHAWAMMPRAAELIGEATNSELVLWCDSADELARRHGVESPYTELAGELVALGEQPALARMASFWAARRFFGADPRATRELDGPTDEEIAAQRLAFEADREEAETRRFYREDFPAIAAARGQRAEDSQAWQIFGHAFAAPASEFVCPSPFGVVREMPLHEVPSSRQVDWPADRIRDEYRRFWSTAERRFWDGEYQAAKPHAADELEAARFATRRVLDRRIETGTRAAAPESATARARA